jgi:hypothetical protein
MEEQAMNPPAIVYKVTIHLVEGEPVRFQSELGVDEMRNLGAQIEEAMNANYLGVPQQGCLRLIPSHNIREIQIEPSPNVLIAHVIRGAEPVTDEPS